MDAPYGQRVKKAIHARVTEVQLPENDSLHIQVKLLEVKGDLEHTNLNVQTLHTQVGEQFHILGQGVVEARKEDLRRIQELEEQVQRLVDEMAMKEVIIASLVQQLQDLADQRLGMSIPELAQVQEDVQSLARTGEQWDNNHFNQVKGLAAIQRETLVQMPGPMPRLDCMPGWGEVARFPTLPPLPSPVVQFPEGLQSGSGSWGAPDRIPRRRPPIPTMLARSSPHWWWKQPAPLHSLPLGWMVVAQR